MVSATDCIVPDGGYPTEDGYLRVLNKPRAQGGRLVMLHRLEYEKVVGLIPDGYEVNHKCKTRMCCNINHLELLSRSEHKSKDNSQRDRQREARIVAHYLKNPELTQQSLADQFGLSQTAIQKMLKRRITNG